MQRGGRGVRGALLHQKECWCGRRFPVQVIDRGLRREGAAGDEECEAGQCGDGEAGQATRSPESHTCPLSAGRGPARVMRRGTRAMVGVVDRGVSADARCVVGPGCPCCGWLRSCATGL